MRLVILAFALFAVITLYPKTCDGYRILGVMPIPSRSHFSIFEALMKGLARKGHTVDVVSTFPQKKPFPNYTDIIDLPLAIPGFVNNMTFERFTTMGIDVVHFLSTDIGNEMCKQLGHPDMLKLIKDPPKNPPYDLVVVEVFSIHCYMALGHNLKVPVIGISSSVLYPWGHGIIANPANFAFVPNNLASYASPMTLWERVHNTVSAVYHDLCFQHYTSPQDDLIKKYLGPDAPGVREAERSLALIFTNSHPSLNGAVPRTPALIEVGGLHVQDDGAELPRDLKKWMDESTDGFVYFSFGSMVIIETFPAEVLQVFYNSLRKISPIRVLIKILDPKQLPPGLPKNIRTVAWAPQYKVLKHPNVKAFITHGGLMSTQEAIHCAVPMIGFPLFGDQSMNVELYTKMNISVTLDHQDITEEKMDKALKEILFNPLYKNTMRKVSEKFLDRPRSALEEAIYWVEYVIRHGGDALRSPAMDLTWWQIALLDVYAVLLSIAVITITLMIVLLRLIINTFCTHLNPKVTRSKKVN